MKGVIVKKVFKVFGIVLASVLGFVGAVVGVMAAMGKFKTPVVYPTVLSFAVTEQMVIEQIPYSESTAQTATLYSFVLNGSNPSESHKVNRTSCYVWFADGESASLITLCDEYRNPLVADGNNRYLVNCNEEIFYMVNEVEDDAVTDGKVTLMARSTNETLKKPDTPMVIWIDRVAGGIFVKDKGETDAEKATQSITVGVDIGFDFEYVVGVGSDELDDDEALALKPVSKESVKEIELYYNVEGMDYGTDYVRVTKAEVDNPNSPLHSILTYNDEGVFTFKASSAIPKTHTFYIAVFPTYADKQRYEEINATNPMTNFDKLTKVNDDDPVSMDVTTLTVTVENIEISYVGFTDEAVAVNLDLYAEDNYITLNTSSNDSKTFALGLNMKKSLNGDQIDDYTRFDEVTMAGFNADVWSEKKPTFTTTIGDEDVVWEYVDSFGEMAVETTNVIVLEETIYYTDSTYKTVSNTETEFFKVDQFKIIDYIYELDDNNNQVKYYCSNGAAVIGSVSGEVRLLKAGSYLNFFVRAEDPNTELTISNTYIEFDYVTSVTGKGQEKTWNIITKEIPELKANENLTLGILVVNSNGKFVINNYFDTIPVILEPIDLSYTILQNNVDMNITFMESNKVGEGIIYPEVDFDDIVSIKDFSSFNACVLVTAYREDGLYPVDVISNIQFKYNEKTYVLVGYYTETNGVRSFINKVRANANVAYDNKSCEIALLQLKNAYKQTALDIINALLVEIKADEVQQIANGVAVNNVIPKTITLDNDAQHNKYDIVAVYNEIKVSATYILNNDLINVRYYNKLNSTLEDSDGDGIYTADSDLFNDDDLTETKQGYACVYENKDTSRYIRIISKNVSMLEKLVNFYEPISFTIDYDNNYIEISTLYVVSTGDILLEYKAVACLSTENIPINLSIENIGGTIDLGGVIVMSISPKQIVYGLGDNDGNYIALSLSDTLAEQSQDYIKMIVSYSGDAYTYSFKLVQGTNETDLGEDTNNDGKVDYYYSFSEVFNSTTSEHEGKVPFGFQDEVYKGVLSNVTYSSFDSDIFNPIKPDTGTHILAKKTGETVLAVTIKGKTQYLKIETETDGKFKLEKETITDKFTDGCSLDKLVKFTHTNASSDITLSQNNFVYITNVRVSVYGDGDLSVVQDADKNWTLSKNSTPVLTIISNETNGWVLTKHNAYVSLTITFDVETIAGNSTGHMLTFESDISVKVNDAWTNNRIFYVDTTVKLKDDYTTNDESNSFYTVFDENNTTTSVTSSENIFYAIDGFTNPTRSEPSNTVDITDAMIGNIKIIAYLREGESGNYTYKEMTTFTDFVVLPNVVASVTRTNATTEESYALDSIYDLKSYDTDVTYGSDEKALYDHKTYYTDDTYETTSNDVTDYFNYTNLIATPTDTKEKLEISFSSQNNDDPQLSWYSTSQTLSISDMKEVKSIERQVWLTYNFNSNPKTYQIVTTDGTKAFNLNITNKWDIKIQNTLQENNTITLKALKEYNVEDLIKITNNDGFTLTGIAIDNIQVEITDYEEATITDFATQKSSLYELNEGVYSLTQDTEQQAEKTYYTELDNPTFKITSTIKETYKDVTLIFTFTKNTQTLTYTTTNLDPIFVIEPYTPYTFDEDGDGDTSITTLFSGSSYDLINDVYNIEDSTNFDTGNIQSLFVTKVVDENGGAITKEFTSGSGYVNGQTGASCPVVFSEIIGASKTILVTYEITCTDANATTYEYTLEFKLRNRQTISTQKPEEGIKFDQVNLRLIDSEYASQYKGEIENEFVGATESSYSAGLYSFDSIEVEPLLISTDTTTTIRFDKDPIKNVVRATVKNESGANTTFNTGTDVSITLVAYQSLSNMDTYCAQINCSTNQITFAKSPETGFYGILLFRLSTASGNYAYYAIRVYTSGSTSSTDTMKTENNMDVVAYSNSNYYQSEFMSIKMEENHSVNSEEYDSRTYYGLVSSIDSTVFANTFHHDFDSKTELYLYYAESTDVDNNFIYGTTPQWKKLSETVTIPQDAKFNKIVIGLVYNNGAKVYCYGTITIYVQPTISISEPTGTDDVTTLGYEKPDGNFTATIQANADTQPCPFADADASDSDSWTATIVSIAGSTNADYIAKVDSGNSTVKLEQRVPTDTEILVQYTYNGTIIFVTYTYLKTEIPTESNVEIEIGEFVESSGFNKKIDLNSTANKDTFFKSYVPVEDDALTAKDEKNYSIGADSTNCSISGTKLTFTQTTETQTIYVQITYMGMTESPSRTFTFKVLPGVHIDSTSTASTASDSGLSSDKPIITTPTNNYGQLAGSTMKVEYTSNRTYHKFKLGGLIIYSAEECYLELTFNKNNYVVSGSNVLTAGEKYTINSSTSAIGFVHTVSTKPVEITSIEIYKTDGSVKYNTEVTSLYVSVQPTYSELLPVYLTNGATHENVASGSTITDLHDKLFNTTYNGEDNRVRYIILGNQITDTTATADTTNYDYYKLNTTTGKYELVEGLTHNESLVTNYFPSPKTYDFVSMGFTTTGNPNCISFKTNGETGIIKNDGTELSFNENSSTKNLRCELLISNSADLTSGNANTYISYIYQVMNGSFVDGLDYSVKNGYDATSESPSYISFGMQDTDSTVAYSNESSPFVIGKMKDSENSTVFSIDSITGATYDSNNYPQIKTDADGNPTAIYYELKLYSVITLSSAPGDWTKYYTKSSDEFTQCTSRTEYSETETYYVLGDYTATLSFNLSTRNIELVVSRIANAELSNIELKISLGGVNGGNTLVQDLTIYLSKDTVTSTTDAQTDTVYANDTVYLFKNTGSSDYVEGGKFKENGGNQPTLTYELLSCTYQFSGEDVKRTLTIPAVSDKKYKTALFTYDMENYYIAFNSTHIDTDLVITFNVKSASGYVIQTITYKVTVKLNFRFTVNGEAPHTNETDLVTNFVLQATEDTESTISNVGYFPISIKIGSTYGSTDSVANEPDGNKTYYNSLWFDLYQISSQAKQDTQNVTISCATSDAYELALINKVYYLKFNKDFNGTIVLTLSQITSTGRYYQQDWDIVVHGIKNIEYAKTSETARLSNKTYAFDSGTVVNIISNTDDNDVGILMSNPNVYETKIYNEVSGLTAETSSVYGYYTYDSTQGIYTQITDSSAKAVSGTTYYQTWQATMNYEYRVHSNLSKLENSTNEELFNDTSADNGYIANTATAGTKSQDGSLNLFKVTLPNVPMSVNAGASYLVTYKVYVTYLGLTKETAYTFYVTYLVKNDQKISTYEITSGVYSEVVNIDNRLTETKLDLFYYAETLTVDNTDPTPDTTYTLTYIYDEADTDGNKYKYQLSDGTNTGYADSISTTGLTEFKDGETIKFQYELSTNKLYDETGTEIGEMETQIYNKGDQYSVFSSDFGNIVKFADFISKYKNKDFVRLGDKDYVAVSLNNGDSLKGYYEKDANGDFNLITDETTYSTGTYYKEKLYTLAEIADGRYGINLVEHSTATNPLITNELCTSLSLIEDGIPLVTVEPYSSTNAKGFRLYPTTVITAKSSKLLSDMSLNTYTTINNSDFTLDTPIIGIGNPSKETSSGSGVYVGSSWINNGTFSEIVKDGSDNKLYATIKVPSCTYNGSEFTTAGYNKYYIYRAKFSGGTGTSALLSTDAYFFYIDFGTESTDAKFLVAPQYTNTNNFLIDSTKSEDGKVSFNLTDSVLVWTMSEGKITNATDDVTYDYVYYDVSRTARSSAKLAISDSVVGVLDFVDTNTKTSIYVSALGLLEYHILNPDEFTYNVTANMQVKYDINTVNLQFMLQYTLSNLTTVSLNSDSLILSQSSATTKYLDYTLTLEDNDWYTLSSTNCTTSGYTDKIAYYSLSEKTGSGLSNDDKVTLNLKATNKAGEETAFTIVVTKITTPTS